MVLREEEEEALRAQARQAAEAAAVEVRAARRAAADEKLLRGQAVAEAAEAEDALRAQLRAAADAHAAEMRAARRAAADAAAAAQVLAHTAQLEHAGRHLEVGQLVGRRAWVANAARSDPGVESPREPRRRRRFGELCRSPLFHARPCPGSRRG